MSFAHKNGEEEMETGRERADDGIVTEDGLFYNPRSSERE